MAVRTVYGNTVSENGWPIVDQASCEWVLVPGTKDVNLQIQSGQPAKILGAYAADYNAFVEPLRDRDSASWTATNSVSTSNHLGGTALDLNWDSHPFRVADAGYTPEMIATMNEILDFYEGTVFWANNWTDPKDAMHHQMGYDTYRNPKTQSFIDRKIRSDGFSTFRRGPITADKMVVAPAAKDGWSSHSLYRTPNEGPLGGIDVFEVNADAMLHQLFVEWSVIQLGDPDSVYRVVRVAAGSGADTSDWAKARARAVLKRAPKELLAPALTRIEQAEPDLLRKLLEG